MAGHEVFCLVTAFVTTLLYTVVSFTCVLVYRWAGHEVFCLVTAKAPFFLTKFFDSIFLYHWILVGTQTKTPDNVAIISSDKNSRTKNSVNKLYHPIN